MTAKNSSGKLGEGFAARYMESHGYKILHRNYRCAVAEIDIIAMDGDVLCFAEVKTRKNKLYGTGAEFVDWRKREKLILGARSYIASKKVRCPMRFDVVEVYGSVTAAGFAVSEINIIKNAFDV